LTPETYYVTNEGSNHHWTATLWHLACPHFINNTAKKRCQVG